MASASPRVPDPTQQGYGVYLPTEPDQDINVLYEPENEVLDAYYLSNVEGNANGAQIIYKNVYIHEFSDEQLVETMDMRVVRVAAPQARFVPVIGDYAELTCSASDIADFPPGRWPVTIMGVHPTSTDVMFRNCAGQCIPHTGVPIERLSPLWLYDQERAEYFYLNGGTAVFASSVRCCPACGCALQCHRQKRSISVCLFAASWSIGCTSGHGSAALCCSSTNTAR